MSKTSKKLVDLNEFRKHFKTFSNLEVTRINAQEIESAVGEYVRVKFTGDFYGAIPGNVIAISSRLLGLVSMKHSDSVLGMSWIEILYRGVEA